jgi:SAM-dependent methyltransferase
VICVSCGAEATVLIKGGVLPAKAAVWRCSGCGLDFFDGADDGDYWETAGQSAIYEDVNVAAERVSSFAGILDKVEALVGRGRMLDVGAGKGEFALAAAARGWGVSVVEPSVRTTQGLVDQGVRAVHNCAFEDFRPEPVHRCVTLLDLIEHTRDPRATFERAAACLEPGGALVILTPDGGSLARTGLLYASRIWGRAATLLKYQYYLPHYSYVNVAWFSHAAKECGLDVVALTRATTPRRFLLAKLKTHYGKYPGNGLFRFMVAAGYPLARLAGNKLLFIGRMGACR